MGNICIPEKEEHHNCKTELGIYCFKKDVCIPKNNNQGTPRSERDKKYYSIGGDHDDLRPYIIQQRLLSGPGLISRKNYPNGTVKVNIF